MRYLRGTSLHNHPEVSPGPIHGSEARTFFGKLSLVADPISGIKLGIC